MSCASFFHLKSKIRQGLTGLGAIVTIVAVGAAAAPRAEAATFQDGVILRAGFTTLTSPPDLDAAVALLTSSNDRTLRSTGLGSDFALGSNNFDLSGTTVRASCFSTLGCGMFNSPAAPDFFGLIISDTAVAGGALDPILSVTSSILDSSRIFFNSNTIILDLSGLTLPGYPSYSQLADVTFGMSSVVPLPAALPLLASGLGALGVLGWRRSRKPAAAA